MTSRAIRSCLALCALLSLAATASATTVIRRTLPELTAGADLIFVGRCEAVSCHWSEDRSLILTANRFRVLRVLKGAPGAVITLDELGGRVGDVGMDVAGMPRYTVGEEVLLFVHRTELGRWETHGMDQGRFEVSRGSDGRPWIRNDLYRAELAAMTPRGRRGNGAPLDAFATFLRATARAEGRRR